MNTEASDRMSLREEASVLWTRYLNMLVAAEKIPTFQGFLAWFYTWLLLAGFLVLPGTFDQLKEKDLGSGFVATVLGKVEHLPFAAIGFLCTGFAVIGMGYLWWKWMNNYGWLVGKLFLPGLVSAFTGIISILINLYTAQKWEFNTMSIITLSVTGGVGVVCGALVVLYSSFLLKRAEREHKGEHGEHDLGKHGGGLPTIGDTKPSESSREIEEVDALGP